MNKTKEREHHIHYSMKENLDKGVLNLFKTLEQSGFELPNATADGVLIQPVRLFEGIEPT